jgi:hypothetical protein
VSHLHHPASSTLLTREYGPGLGYPPVETAVLAGLGIFGALLLVIGYLGLRYSWWTSRQFAWVIRMLSRGKSERHGSEAPPTRREGT